MESLKEQLQVHSGSILQQTARREVLQCFASTPDTVESMGAAVPAAVLARAVLQAWQDSVASRGAVKLPSGALCCSSTAARYHRNNEYP